jgi:hypothetical protein
MTEASTEITAETQRAILAEMRRIWLNTRFQTEAELRIQGRLKAHLKRETAEAERGLLERLRDCEVAIQTLDEELAALAEPPAA